MALNLCSKLYEVLIEDSYNQIRCFGDHRTNLSADSHRVIFYLGETLWGDVKEIAVF